MLQKRKITMIFLIIFSLFLLILLCLTKKKEGVNESDSEAAENLTDVESEQLSKGYDLPIPEEIRKNAEKDCKEIMNQIREIYITADIGDASNAVLSEDIIFQMVESIQETGVPVFYTQTYSNMRNYEVMEQFLKTAAFGETGNMVLYEVLPNGGISRKYFSYNGTDMYVLESIAIWNGNLEPVISTSYTKIKEWKYTEKGWFCYQLCVPEYPEVTEIVDGSCLIRVQPMSEENLEMTEKYISGLGYQGNNLLCSDWDKEHMEDLDYSGMYEYLYSIKYGKSFDSNAYVDGIPAVEFESLIMEYLPISSEQIRQYASYSEETDTYAWSALCCLNYTPTYFGTSVPEVVDSKINKDGTVTLTIDAICEMVLCNDALITHTLIIRPLEDGSFQYLGNEIQNGIENIPDYQYRITK